MLAVVQGPSPHGDQYRTITYKRGATQVVHDRASLKRLTAVHATSPPPRPAETPVPPAQVLPPKGVRQLQSTLHAFFQPRVQLPEDLEDTDAIPLASNSPPRDRAPSPTLATEAMVVDCQKRPSKRRPKALRLAKLLRKHRTARQKLEYVAYADQHGDKQAAKDLGVAPKSFRDWRAIKHVLEAQAKRGKLGKLTQHPGKKTRAYMGKAGGSFGRKHVFVGAYWICWGPFRQDQ